MMTGDRPTEESSLTPIFTAGNKPAGDEGGGAAVEDRPPKCETTSHPSGGGKEANSPVGGTAAFLGPAFRHSGAVLTKAALRGNRIRKQLARRMRLREWRRRYLGLLTLVHRHVFDRRVEFLLFTKTPTLPVYDVVQTDLGPDKTFHYKGPMPRKVFDWALSALPASLKRFAFTDFDAGHGRTLLLASRRDFEHITGYAGPDSFEILQMNAAQYPRSYMGCRDVRLRLSGQDPDEIPAQAAILFFPDSLSEERLKSVLESVSESVRQSPREFYLIFENAGREQTCPAMKLFEKVPLPILNRIKAFFFNPAKIAVYRSVTGAGEE
ncbi:MAG: hypothetical protein WBX25_14060 [Rhodomicrobium sp.]